MRVLVVNAQVPFVRGGAEVLAERLVAELRSAGHQAEPVGIPFNWVPAARIPEHALACRLLDLQASAGLGIDRVIALKFPAWLVRHPHKVLWIIHQHRAAYDLWDHPLGDLAHEPDGAVVRDAIREADRSLLGEARRIFTIARTVSDRLERWCGVASRPVYHPPDGHESFHPGAARDYLFFPSRLWPTKRQELVLEALARTRSPVRVRFAGTADHPAHAERLRAAALGLGVADRVEWLGRVGEADKRELYAGALGVVFPPVDEDYGYVTLEAMLSHKAVVTCRDSGGPLEFVVDGETGLVAGPEAGSLADALDRLWDDRGLAARLGAAARDRYASLDIRWDRVLEELLG